jgi:hypothetical protein
MQLDRGATTTAPMQSSDPLRSAQSAVHNHHKVPCTGLPCAQLRSASAGGRGIDSGSSSPKNNGANESTGSDLVGLDHISKKMLLQRRNFYPLLGAADCVNELSLVP